VAEMHQATERGFDTTK